MRQGADFDNFLPLFHSLMTHYILDARTAVPHFPGIGRYVRSFSSALIPQLNETERLTLLNSPASSDLAGIASHNGESLTTLVSPFDLSQQWRIPLLLKQLRTDSETLYHSPYYLMPYRTGLPTLLTFYDLIPIKYPQTVAPKARLFFRLAASFALRKATRVVAISQSARSDLIDTFHVPGEKVSVTPLAAGRHYRPQPADEVDRVRAEYGLPRSFLLYVGINKPHKNLLALVDAYAQFASPHTPPLVIAGAWDDRYPQPKQRVARLHLGDATRFLGPIPERDLPALYSAATLFIFPSLYEGFGLPVLEAMSSGTPVACANTPGLTEIAADAARLFNPHSVPDIADAIAELLEDSQQRDRRSELGLARAARFSWGETAATTLNCYRELLQ